LVISLVQCVSASQLSDASKCDLLTLDSDGSGSGSGIVGGVGGELNEKYAEIQKEYLQEGNSVAATIVTGILKVSRNSKM
jgi:hypothetical protein